MLRLTYPSKPILHYLSSNTYPLGRVQEIDCMEMSRFLIFIRKFIFSEIAFLGRKPIRHNFH